jgi:hypothetical protein
MMPQSAGVNASVDDDDGSTVRASASEVAAAVTGAGLAPAVMFVHDLDSSMRFCRELLMTGMLVNNTSTLLASMDGFQLYLGPSAQHGLGGVGVQHVIWTATDEDDPRRCERLLRERGGHVRTKTGDGFFTVIEGRDPSDVPVVLTCPGPVHAARHEIMSRIYEW